MDKSCRLFLPPAKLSGQDKQPRICFFFFFFLVMVRFPPEALLFSCVHGYGSMADATICFAFLLRVWLIWLISPFAQQVTGQ